MPDVPPDYVPDLAPEFNVGENVLLRGGSHDPTTNWDIVKIGTNLITLRDKNGEIKIAQKGDLYRPSDIVQSPNQIQPLEQVQHIYPIQEQQQQQQQPGINIAPVFNFGTMETIDKIPSVVKCEPEPTIKMDIDGGGGDGVVSSGDVIKPQEEPIDFNRLIIKKL